MRPSGFHAFRNGMSIARRHATRVRSFGAFHGFIVLCRAIATAAAKAGVRTLSLGQHWVSLMNLGGAEMSANRVRSQSGRCPAKADTRWQASPAVSVANDPTPTTEHW